MRRVLWIVSLVTLVVLGAGILGQALIVLFGVYYAPSGDPADPTPLAVIVTALDLGGLIAMPLTAAALILGLITTAQDRRYGWLVAVVLATLLACVGLIGMAWVILSVNSPIAFQTPLAAIALVTAAYSRSSDPHFHTARQH
jgi:hypothetical protein